MEQWPRRRTGHHREPRRKQLSPRQLSGQPVRTHSRRGSVQGAPRRQHKELYLSYRLRFGSGFQYVKGGKLPGLVGGTAPTDCISDHGGFSARGMWRPGGAAVQYLYYPDKKNRCGDDFSYVSDGRNFVFVPGKWQTIEHRIVMNTPGQRDGILQAWVDGALVLDENQFYYCAPGATFAIDALYFSTFFGGSDSTWAPATDQTVDYDDFIVSSRPITH